MTIPFTPRTPQGLVRRFIPAPTLLFILFALAGVSVAAAPTMRLDYYHSGNASEELFSLDKLIIEPLPWPGNPHQPVDHTNLGKYLFEVISQH